MTEFDGQTRDEVRTELEAQAKTIAKMSKAEQERFFAEITSNKTHCLDENDGFDWLARNRQRRAEIKAQDDDRFEKGQKSRTTADFFQPGAN